MSHTAELTLMDGTTTTVPNVDPDQPLVIYGVDPEQEHRVKITDTDTPATIVVTDFVGPTPKKRNQ